MIIKDAIREEIKDWQSIVTSCLDVMDAPQGLEEWKYARKDLEVAERNIQELETKLNIADLLTKIDAVNLALQYALLGNPKKNNFTTQDRETVEAVTKLLDNCANVIKNIE